MTRLGAVCGLTPSFAFLSSVCEAAVAGNILHRQAEAG
jgi:hypothetical protein